MDWEQKIRKYIARTKMSERTYKKYNLTSNTLEAIHDVGIKLDSLEMICLAFDYGMAKGYRAGIAQAKCGDSNG